MPPATLATFLVTAERVVDFTGGYDPQHWSPIWAEAYCDWKHLNNFLDVEPPSWVIGDLVREAGAAGLLYRSARDPSEVCLVLYPELGHTFTAPVHDPNGLLPRNRDSWPRP